MSDSRRRSLNRVTIEYDERARSERIVRLGAQRFGDDRADTTLGERLVERENARTGAIVFREVGGRRHTHDPVLGAARANIDRIEQSGLICHRLVASRAAIAAIVRGVRIEVQELALTALSSS